MANSCRKLRNVLIDALSLVAVGVPLLLIKYLISPKKRGFFCHDESIRYPYFSSTITTPTNVLISYGVPVLIIIVNSFVQKTAHVHNSSTRTVMEIIYRDVTLFFFGVFTVQLLTNVGKLTAGRLRPHFHDVCNSNSSSLAENGECGVWARPVYVSDWTCPGNPALFSSPTEREHRIREASLSFPSGHASLAWYGMVFGAGYLHLAYSSTHRRFTLPIGVVQVALLVYGLVVAVSRVTDNKHHPTDVLAGAVLGAGAAVIALTRTTPDHSRKHYAELKVHAQEDQMSRSISSVTKEEKL